MKLLIRLTHLSDPHELLKKTARRGTVPSAGGLSDPVSLTPASGPCHD